jgi:hypothetical protein
VLPAWRYPHPVDPYLFPVAYLEEGNAASASSVFTGAALAARLLRVRWVVRAPIGLYQARLGFLFGSRLLMLDAPTLTVGRNQQPGHRARRSAR